ncbi:hypothetical protein Tco_0852758, partial [Tanacetum coccineum]
MSCLRSWRLLRRAILALCHPSTFRGSITQSEDHYSQKGRRSESKRVGGSELVTKTAEGSATATDLLKAITLVVNLWLARRCPPILAEFVASALLTPLLKPDNGFGL